MTTPKRVWSNKKTVWDGKKGVWKVGDEIATYDGTWSKAEGQLTVYGNSWENLSGDDNLEVYDSSSATEIGTVEENQGGGGDVPCTAIWFNILANSIKIGETKIIGYAQPEPYEPVHATVNLIATGSYEGILSITVGEKDESGYPVTATGLSAGTATVSIQDTLTGTTSINAVSVSCAGVYGGVEIDEAQSDLAPTVGNNGTIKINNMPGAFTMSWSPDGVCTVSEVDQANSSIIYTAETVGDCTFTITDNTNNANTASCSISVQPEPLAVPSLIFNGAEEGSENEMGADVSYYPPDQGADAYWYPTGPISFKLEGLDPSVEDAVGHIRLQTTEDVMLDFVAEETEDADRPYQITGSTMIDQLVFTDEQQEVACNVIWDDWDAGTETVIGTLTLTITIPEINHLNDDQNIQLTDDGNDYTGSGVFLPVDGLTGNTIDTNITPLLYYYDESTGEGEEAYVGSVQIVANEDSSTSPEYPYVLEVTIPTSDVTPPTGNNYYYVQIQRAPGGDSYLTLNGMFVLQFPSS